MIYLDAAASTPLRPEVRDVMEPWLADAGGNPSSLHAPGRRARKAIEDAREQVAAALGADPREIAFTSGATESNTWAVLGIGGRHVVTTAVEHPSVLEACAAAERRGVRVTRVGVSSDGLVDPAAVASAVGPDTALVSVQAVNNETGAVQPVEEIRRRLPAAVVFHVDAAQALGKVPFDARIADLVTFSAHKVHGPKGVGGLLVRRRVALAPLLAGGGQELGRRAGTENVAGIVGLAEAVDLAVRELPEAGPRAAALRDRLEAALLAVGGAALNGPKERRAPHVLNVSFDGVDGETAVLALDAEGVAASSGSACASGGTEPSHVLLAMGLPRARAKGGIRFSVSARTADRDVEEAAGIVPRVVERLRTVRR